MCDEVFLFHAGLNLSVYYDTQIYLKRHKNVYCNTHILYLALSYFESMKQKSDSQRIHDIGKRIKELRRKAGYTSYETFAYENDIDRRQYWGLENGKNFKLTTLFKIVNIHNISLEDFWKGLK